MPQDFSGPETILDQARRQYPILNKYNFAFKSNLGGGEGYLESWPPQETGTFQRPRPKEFPIDQFGIENYRPDTRTIDVLGDVVSHYLVNSDPTIQNHYQSFIGSLEPWQKSILQEQYRYAVMNEGEQRPYQTWEANTGIPAYFRGYAFQQWPDSKHYYTRQQLKTFDDMMNYLSGKK